MDVQKKAQDLAAALKAHPAFAKLKETRETIDQHEAAKIMLRDFQKKQRTLLEQQQNGEEISESQKHELQRLHEIMYINPYLKAYLEAEMEFAQLWIHVEQALAEVMTELQGQPAAEDESHAEKTASTVEKPTKKLWTPGSDS